MVHQYVVSVIVHVEEIQYCSMMIENFSISIQDFVLFQRKEFPQQQTIMLSIFQTTFTIHLTHLAELDQTELIVLMVARGGMLILFGKKSI